MTHTKDYKHTLDLDNVIAVDYDEDGDIVRVYVTEKVPEDELDETQLVAANVDRDTDVVEVGDLQALSMPMAQGDRKNRIRPVPGGVSEANSTTTAGTGGPYPVKVTDTGTAEWDEDVEEGDVVRLSNLHVYAPPDSARLGQRIWQPGPYDGGSTDDEVGRLAGYAPLGDGVTVDVAARTSTVEESESYLGLDSTYGNGVFRGSFSKGDRVIKSGRTTGVTTGAVQATSASARIDYGGNTGVITLRDLVFTDHMLEPGDSGSAVFMEESGDVAGQMFAGSQKISVFFKAANAESELGVEIMPQDDTTDERYVTSLDTTVDIAMEERDLDLVEFTGDKPGAGETVDATATVRGNYGGTAYLKVQGETYTFEMGETDVGYKAEVAVEVTAPDEYQETFPINIEGGYVV